MKPCCGKFSPFFKSAKNCSEGLNKRVQHMLAVLQQSAQNFASQPPFEAQMFAVRLIFMVLGTYAWFPIGASELRGENSVAKERNLQQIQWGAMFDGLGSENVPYNCSNNGLPICCGVLKDYGLHSRSHSEQPLKPHLRAAHEVQQCKLEKKYSPSAYELRHYEIALRIQAIGDENGRREAMVDEMILDIPHANEWLGRIYLHMQPGDPPPESPLDEQYLSKFIVNQTCHTLVNGEVTATTHSSWKEWIEPLNIQTRHPFAHTKCKKHEPAIKRWRDEMGKMKFDTAAQGVDYILLQHGRHTHHSLPAAHISEGHEGRGHQPRSFMLDAGTSTFDSSLKWFYCAYLQMNITFDESYGWEYTLLEPNKFWQSVPDGIKPHYHFFNAPITAAPTSPQSPLRFIREIARESDFVAFKLDVDTPTVELPIALELLRDPTIGKLVDEFFFELHFRCDLMMSCAWGYEIPVEFDGLKLDRPSTLKYFSDLRHAGMRAHIWP